MEAFELKIRGSFNAHNNMVRMLDKRLNEISDSQVELAETLLNINEKVNEMEEMIGWLRRWNEKKRKKMIFKMPLI